MVVILIALGGAAGFAWFTYGDRLAEMPSFASGLGSTSAPATASDTSSVATAEFQAFQQQTSTALQSATQMLSEQQAELKKLSDDVVGLTAKIDQLQGSLATARPASPPVAASSYAPAAAAPVLAAAPRRRPVAPPRPPAGAISLGGAPLPGSPAR